MDVSNKLMTAEELFHLPNDGYRYELLKGELRKMPPAGFEHGSLAIKIGWRLGQYVETNDLGLALAAETGFKISSNPDTVRAPDVGFVRKERIHAELPKGYFPGAPDLAVEIISPSDTFQEVEEKVLDWLESGTSLVWVINPNRRRVTVYRSPTDIIVLTENDELSGEDTVLGFRCRISELFA